MAVVGSCSSGSETNTSTASSSSTAEAPKKSTSNRKTTTKSNQANSTSSTEEHQVTNEKKFCSNEDINAIVNVYNLSAKYPIPDNEENLNSQAVKGEFGVGGEEFTSFFFEDGGYVRITVKNDVHGSAALYDMEFSWYPDEDDSELRQIVYDFVKIFDSGISQQRVNESFDEAKEYMKDHDRDVDEIITDFFLDYTHDVDGGSSYDVRLGVDKYEIQGTFRVKSGVYGW